MADREKVRLMTKLALLEKYSGKKIRKAENTSRIDLITNPVWRWGFAVTLLFILAVSAFAVLNMDMVLDAVSRDQTKNLIMIVLIAWLSLLAITVLVSFVLSLSRTRRVDGLREEYLQMLKQLERISRMDERYDRRRRDYPEEDLWDEPSGKKKGRRGGRTREEDLDYGHMEVLEFEDDDYCYYVEAVPKRTGSGSGKRRERDY